MDSIVPAADVPVPSKRRRRGPEVPRCAESEAQYAAWALCARRAAPELFDPQVGDLVLQLASNAVPVRLMRNPYAETPYHTVQTDAFATDALLFTPVSGGHATPHVWVTRPGLVERRQHPGPHGEPVYGKPVPDDLCSRCGVRGTGTRDLYPVDPVRRERFICCAACGLWICRACAPDAEEEWYCSDCRVEFAGACEVCRRAVVSVRLRNQWRCPECHAVRCFAHAGHPCTTHKPRRCAVQ